MTYELKLPPKASLLPEPPEASDEFYVRLELFLYHLKMGVRVLNNKDAYRMWYHVYWIVIFLIGGLVLSSRPTPPRAGSFSSRWDSFRVTHPGRVNSAATFPFMGLGDLPCGGGHSVGGEGLQEVMSMWKAAGIQVCLFPPRHFSPNIPPSCFLLASGPQGGQLMPGSC